MIAKQSNTRCVALLSTALMGALALTTSEALADTRNDGYKDVIERQLAFDSGASLTLTNRNGSVTINSWDKDEIKIVATKRMKIERFGSWFARLLGFNAPKIESDEEAQKYLDEFTFEVSGEADGMEIKTVEPHESSAGMQFTMSYAIVLPQRADISVEVSNGKINIQDIQGEISAETSNGSISFEDLSGYLQARTTNGSIQADDISGGLKTRTVNGSIHVDYREDAILAEDINCRSTNGSIHLSLPADSHFELAARTSSGKIISEFQFAAVEEESRKRVVATIGNGGPTITLRNTNGTVEIEAND